MRYDSDYDPTAYRIGTQDAIAIVSWRLGRAGVPAGQGVWTVDIGSPHRGRDILAREISEILPLPEAAPAADLIEYVMARWTAVDHVIIEANRPYSGTSRLANSGPPGGP